MQWSLRIHLQSTQATPCFQEEVSISFIHEADVLPAALRSCVFYIHGVVDSVYLCTLG